MWCYRAERDLNNTYRPHSIDQEAETQKGKSNFLRISQRVSNRVGLIYFSNMNTVDILFPKYIYLHPFPLFHRPDHYIMLGVR